MTNEDMDQIDFSGKWDVTFGYHLICVQINNDITGKFYHPSNPRLWGTVKGSTDKSIFRGQWKIKVPLDLIPEEFRPKSNGGDFEFKISSDGKHFEGILNDLDKDANKTIKRPWKGDKLC